MNIIIGGEETVILSIHYDKGQVPEITVVDLAEDRIPLKEIKIGKVTIQVFERVK